MAFPTVSVLDNFNRADGALGADWGSAFGDPAPVIIGNLVRGPAASWYGARYQPAGTPTAYASPQEAYYTLPSDSPGSSQTAAVIARGTSLNGGSYSGYVARINGTAQLQIGKYVTGTYTALVSGPSTLVPAAGDKIGIEVIGTSSPVTINLYYAPAGVWPGTPTLTFSDSSSPLTSGGEVGVSFNQGSATTGGMDDFAAGTTGGGGSPVILSTLQTFGPSQAAQRAASI